MGETMVWGEVIERWTINSAGAGRITTTGGFGPTAKTSARAVELSPDAFRVVLETLQPLANSLISGLPCEGPLPTDLGTVSITWSRKATSSEFSLYGGCHSKEADKALAAFEKARQIVLPGVAKSSEPSSSAKTQ